MSDTNEGREAAMDDDAVDKFARLMKEKMALSRAKGRHGWADPEQCSPNFLRALLYEHIYKGDPVDVANLCMMLRHYDEPTTPRPEDDLRLPRTERDAAVARALTVKPLEWEDLSQRNNQTHVARSVFGDYYVHIDGGRHQAWLEAHVKPYENMIGSEVGYLEEAKDAAQADYAARVRALIRAPDLARAALTTQEPKP